MRTREMVTQIHVLRMMPRYVLTIVLTALLFTVLVASALGNAGTVTFFNGAQKMGPVSAFIYWGEPADHCVVLGTINHAVGTSAEDKAKQFVKDINTQCGTDVEAEHVEGTGSMRIKSKGDKKITEISVYDYTGQRKSINPHSLDDGKFKVVARIGGLGTGGTATISMDDCGSSASTSTYGKTGAQIVAELVAELVNCDSANGCNIVATDLGDGGTGEIIFYGLSSGNSTITFDPGDTSLVDLLSVKVVSDIPTLSEWAMIVFAVVILALMTYVVVRRRRSLQPTTA